MYNVFITNTTQTIKSANPFCFFKEMIVRYAPKEESNFLSEIALYKM